MNLIMFKKIICKSCQVIFALALISCDSVDDIPVKDVHSTERLSDAELTEINQNRQRESSKQEVLENIFYFGFDLRNSPQEDIAQYIPFLKYLESATGYKFKLYLVGKDNSVIDELGKNNIQFAAMGAVSYIKANSQYGAQLLVQGLNEKNRAEYRSYLITLPNSRINRIPDVRGRTFAFGSKNSTQGFLIPRIILDDNNIDLKDLRSYAFTGSHQRCAEAVISGRADVCGLQDSLAEKLSSEGKVKIFYRSKYYPSSGIVANNSVSEDVAKKVKRALLDFDPSKKYESELYHWEQTEMPNGFVDSKMGGYKVLAEWLERLNLLSDEK